MYPRSQPSPKQARHKPIVAVIRRPFAHSVLAAGSLEPGFRLLHCRLTLVLVRLGTPILNGNNELTGLNSTNFPYSRFRLMDLRAEQRRAAAWRGRNQMSIDPMQSHNTRASRDVGLQHAHAIAFRIEKGNVSTDSGISIGSPRTLPPAWMTRFIAESTSSTATTIDGYCAGQSGLFK